jgi:hypothetical protein
MRKVLSLALLALLAPSCDKSILPPQVIDSAPGFGAGNIAHWPFMVLQWDQAMDPATMTGTNIAIFDNIGPTKFGPSPTVTYLPGSKQTLVATQQSLDSPTATPNSGQYIVAVSSAVKSLTGTPVTTTLYAGTFFTVTSNALVYPPVFSSPVASAGTTLGTIDIKFTLATVFLPGAPATNPPMNGNYDVYRASASGGEDLLAGASVSVDSGTVASNAATASLPAGTGLITITPVPAMTTGTQYFFIIVARDTSGNVTPAAEISFTAP